MSDSPWELYAEDNVVVARFPEGMPADEDEFAKVNEQFEELIADEDVTAHISFVQMDDALHEGVYRKAAEAARVGKDYGVTKWAMVSEGIKKMAVASSINDIEGVETMTTSSFEEAMEWARE